VIARVLEERGLSTIAMSLVREHTVKIKPPRAVWVPFPFGMSIGHRNDIAEQRAVLDLAFSTLDAPAGPVLLDFVAAERRERAAPLQASDVEVEAQARTIDLTGEVGAMRLRWEALLAGTRSHVGASGVEPVQFGAMVRFLEDYAAGNDAADFAGRPPEVPVLQFIRYAVEDLRVMYAETRMREHPEEAADDLQRWLLGSTALGVFMRALRDRMDASTDPKVKAAALGIAR
jgi:hypothetical protein